MKEINYSFGDCDVTCDMCEKSKTVDSTNYSDINDELRSEGWIIKKIDGEWLEFCCYDCYRKYKEGSE